MSAAVRAIISKSKELLEIDIDETTLRTVVHKKKGKKPRRNKSEAVIEAFALDSNNFAPCLKKKRQDLNKCLEVYDVKMFKLRTHCQTVVSENTVLRKKISSLKEQLQEYQDLDNINQQLTMRLRRNIHKQDCLEDRLALLKETFTACVETLEMVKSSYDFHTLKQAKNHQKELEISTKLNNLNLSKFKQEVDSLIISISNPDPNADSAFIRSTRYKDIEDPDQHLDQAVTNHNHAMRKQLAGVKSNLVERDVQTKSLQMDYWTMHKHYVDAQEKLRKRTAEFEHQEAQLLKENSELRRRLTLHSAGIVAQKMIRKLPTSAGNVKIGMGIAPSLVSPNSTFRSASRLESPAGNFKSYRHKLLLSTKVPSTNPSTLGQFMSISALKTQPSHFDSSTKASTNFREMESRLEAEKIADDLFSMGKL